MCKCEQGAKDSGLSNLPAKSLGPEVLSALASLEEGRSGHGGCPHPGLLDPVPPLSSSVPESHHNLFTQFSS